MENSSIVLNIIISLSTSIVGGLLLLRYLRHKKDQIRKQIDALNSNEEFVSKLNKSTVKLQRTSFMTVLIALAILFGCLAFLLGSIALGLSPEIMIYVYAICSYFFIVAGGICFQQANSIVDSANLDEAKLRFSQKREMLESKLQ